MNVEGGQIFLDGTLAPLGFGERIARTDDRYWRETGACSSLAQAQFVAGADPLAQAPFEPTLIEL